MEMQIHLIRGERVMLDIDLAELYGVSTKRLNEQVRRNLKRFPPDFAFRLGNQEVINLKSQIATSSLTWGGRRKLPWAFTEHGIAMLSGVLNSERAIEVNIMIIREFIRMRSVLNSNHELQIRIDELESKYDSNFRVVFEAIRRVVGDSKNARKRVKGLSPEE
jgi:hypothetical protein